MTGFSLCIILLPQLASIYVVWAVSSPLILKHAGYVFVYLYYYFWIKFDIEMPNNALLSVVFLVVIVQQYLKWDQIYGPDFPRKDSFTCLELFFQFFCALVAASRAVGDFNDIFFIVDCKLLLCFYD